MIFSSAHAIFFMIYHKTSLNKLKSMFFNDRPVAGKDKRDHRTKYREGLGVGIVGPVE